MGGTNTRSSMLHGLVCDGELTKIMPNHLWLHMNKNKIKRKNEKKNKTFFKGTMSAGGHAQ